jgi:hypothetical protein
VLFAEAMASWKQINEVGGTVVLRTISGLFALVAIVAIVATVSKLLAGGTKSASTIPMLLALLALFGGYALFGNRLRFG